MDVSCIFFSNEIGIGSGPIINEKKLGYDWGAFTGLTLDKDHDSTRIIDELKKIPEVTECYYITGKYTLFIKIVAKDHEHMRAVLYDKIDNIQGIAKTDSIIELGCAFKRNIIPSKQEKAESGKLKAKS